MRKISTNCRPGVIFCRAVFARLLIAASSGWATLSFAQLIEAPAPPLAEPPPVIPPERDPARIRRQQKMEREQETVKADTVSRETIEATRRVEEQKKEASQPRPLYGFVELSLLQPAGTVSKGRSEYRFDMTTHINAYARALWDSDASTAQPWIGIRVAPLNGYGTQNKTTARFSHTWIGPAIGFGRITPPTDLESGFPTRDLLLWSLGVSAVTRLRSPDDGDAPMPKDFESAPWAFDAPGAWSEVRWARIFQGATGVGLMLGTQTGTGKIIYYGGVTVSGFF